MTSHQLARGSGYGSEKPSDGEENLLRGIVSDLSVADDGCDGLAVTLPATVFSVSAQNKSEAAPRKFFDARHAVYPNVGQRTAFDNRDRLRHLVESHLLLPGRKAMPRIVTHICHTRNHELSVSALDSSSFLSRAQNVAVSRQPTKQTNASFLAAPKRGDVSLTAQSSLAASNCRANAALSFKARRQVERPEGRTLCSWFNSKRANQSRSCAPTDTPSLPTESHTRPQPVEAIPGWGTSHTARRQRAA